MTAEHPKITGARGRNQGHLGKLSLHSRSDRLIFEAGKVAIKVGTVEAEQIEFKLLRIKLANKVR